MIDIDEAINRVQNRYTNPIPDIQDNGQISIDDAIRSVQDYDAANASTNSDNPFTWGGALGIGLADMVNNNVVGGVGLGLRTLGGLWEQISPFSGMDNKLAEELMNLGFTSDEIYKLANNNSWLSDWGNNAVELRNYLKGTLDDWQLKLLGKNPSLLARAMRGAGTSLGHMATGYILGTNPITAPLWHAGSEALSEAAGLFADEYEKGHVSNDALWAAYKSLGANLALNSALDYTLGRFAPWTEGTLNPYKRFLYGSVGEVFNELLQEPSQQIIEQAASNSLDKGTNFLLPFDPKTGSFNLGSSELWNSILGQGDYKGKGWWDTFKQVAPETILSTMITSGLIGAGGMSTRQGRQNINNQYQASKVFHDMGIDKFGQAQDYFKKTVEERVNLQNELNSLTAPDVDPDIDNSSRIQELTNLITQADENIKNFVNNFSVFPNAKSVFEETPAPKITPYYNADDLATMQSYRDDLQSQLNSQYQSMTGELDTDIEALNNAQELQALIGNLDNSINNFWRNPEVNANAFEAAVDDYGSDQTYKSKQYPEQPTSTSNIRESRAKNYPEGMFARLGDNPNQNINDNEDSSELDDYLADEDDEEIRNLSRKIYNGIKGFNINNEAAKFVSHIIATGAKHFASYAGISTEDYLKARGFKIVYDTREGAGGRNKGNFDYLSRPTDEQGNILREADSIISIYTKSDVSTFIHENGHFFLNDFRDLFKAGKLKGGALQDWATITNWLGVSDLDFSKDEFYGRDKDRWRDAHEKFAVGFERYLRDGIAPNNKLKRAFEAVKRWMHDIYKTLLNMVYVDSNKQGRHFNISPEVREAMSRIFTDFNNESGQSENLSMFTDEENKAAESENIPPVMAGIQDEDEEYDDNATASRLADLIRNREEEAFRDINPERKFNRQEQNKPAPETNNDSQTQTQTQNIDEDSEPHPNDPNYYRRKELYSIINSAREQLRDFNLEQSERDNITKTLMEAREELRELNKADDQKALQFARELHDRNLREFNEREALNDSGANSGVQGANIENAPSLLAGTQGSQNESPNEKRATTRAAKTQNLIDSLNSKIDENTEREGYSPEENKRQEIITDDEPDNVLDDADSDYESDYDISSIASSLSKKLTERDSENYNQSAPLINDGEILAGRFIFNTTTRPHSLNVVAQADNKHDRLSRQRGRALELRNNRGDVFASYYPYTDTFTFNYTGTNHSLEWKNAFENNFRMNLPEYLSNGGFTDSQGRLRSDGNESFRTRWNKTTAQDPDAFFDDDVRQEDYEAHKKIGSMTVNHNGRQRTFSVYTGEFSSNDPERQKFFGRYLEVRDENNKVLARYSPLAKKLDMSKRKGAEELRTPILEQLKKNSREYLSKGGFLDQNGQLKSDGSEEFRKSYRERKQNIGKTVKIRTIRGTEIQARYRVVEADNLITSNKENGGINPDYPQNLQPRQRDREASQQQIATMAANLDPELLADNRLVSDGAPVIGSDNVVESGNGRVLAIRRAYKTGAAEDYKSWITDNAKRFGLDSDSVAKVKNHVLVRERISDVDRVKFTSEANEASTARMSETETALNDAKKISPEMLTLFDPDKPIAANRAFIREFIQKVVPQSERGDFFQKNGEISKAGINRIENALIAKAYNDSTILNRLNEVYDDDIKNITNALLSAAPKIAVLENGGFRDNLSIQKDIVQAVNALIEIKGEKGSVFDYLSQIRIFDDNISNTAKKLLQFFDRNKRSSKKIAQALINYAESAMKENKQNQPNLPGMEDSSRSKSTILREALNNAENEQPKSKSQSERYNQSDNQDSEEHISQLRQKLRDIRPSQVNLHNLSDKSFITDRLLERYNQDMLHGTGHILLGNKFDLSKIGSGETGAAFGWGIYLAQTRGVAQSYRQYGLNDNDMKLYLNDGSIISKADKDKITPPMQAIFDALKLILDVDGFSDSLDSVKQDIRDELDRRLEMAENWLHDTKQHLSDGDIYQNFYTREHAEAKKERDLIRQSIALLDNIKDMDLPRGNIYEVDGPEDNVLLDWDAKLTQQPEHVKRAINKIKKALAKYDNDYDLSKINNAATGSKFYWALTELMHNLNLSERGDKQASLLLNKFGVPGLRFLDNFSRYDTAGKYNTHNFVVWNTDTLRVMGISLDSDNDAIDSFSKTQIEKINSEYAESYSQPMNDDVRLNDSVNVVRITPTMPDVPFYQRIKAFDKSRQNEIIDKFRNGQVINEHTGLTITLSKQELNHILDTARNNDNIAGKIIYQAVPFLDELARNAYRVETHGDRKPSATKIEGQPGNLKQVHRFLVPVELDDEQHVLKLTAKEYENGNAEIDEVSLYDMKYTKKLSGHLSQNSTNLMERATGTSGSPDNISVRDMLRDVNDTEEHPYYDADDETKRKMLQSIRRTNDAFISPEQIERYNQDDLWHGTRHILLGNIFDLRKIGIGEGAQVFGYGIYVAQAIDVAESYRNSGRPVEDFLPAIHFVNTGGQIIKANNDEILRQIAIDYMDRLKQGFASQDENQAIEDLKSFYRGQIRDNPSFIEFFKNRLNEDKNASEEVKQEWRDHIEKMQKEMLYMSKALKTLDTISTINIDFDKMPGGNIYKIQGPENNILLNWDVSISRQPVKVKRALEKVINKVKKLGGDVTAIQNAKTGQDFYRALTDAMKDILQHRRMRSKMFGEVRRADAAASLMLHREGIPGLRFFDQFSRKSRKGTHNFVIWNTDMLKILGLTEDSDEDAKEYFRKTKAEQEAQAQPSQSESYNQPLQGEIQDWSDTVDRFVNGDIKRNTDGNLIHVMDTPDVFTLVGMDKLPIEIRISNMHKILLRKHHLTPETLKQIPQALADPVMIFKSEHDLSRNRDSRVILTELREKDNKGIERSVMAAITLGRSNPNSGYAINELSTVYKKDTTSKQQLNPDEDIFDWINRKFKDGSPMNLLLYVNKQKARQGAISSGLKPIVFDILNGLPDSIPDEHDLANLTNDNNHDGYENYNQIIGETGTTRLDFVEGSNTRTQNLEIAKQMERKGLSVKKMWAATGWMRGADGKWRYEIPDGKIKGENFKKFYEATKEYDTLSRKVNNYLRNNINNFDYNNPDAYIGLSEQEDKRFKELDTQVISYKISDVFDAPELFRAYPQLRNLDFLFTDSKENWIAYYDTDTKEIAFNMKYYRDDNPFFLSTILIHELQHAVQNIEGFAQGGDSDTIKADKQGRVNVNPFRRKNLQRQEQIIYDNLTQEQKQNFRMLRKNEKIMSKRAFSRLLNETLSRDERKIYTQWRNTQEARKHNLTQGQGKYFYDEEIYENLAGEVEARNASTRSLMDKKSRKRTPLNETEDKVYPRETQFVVDDNGKALNQDNSESYNQIIGEQGAKRLDTKEGITTRMDNLETAKQMEHDGLSVKEIWAATGWTRGAEGKWRYEIPDGRFNKKGLMKLAKISSELSLLEAKTQQDPNYTFTPDEQKKHDDLINEFNKGTLSDIVDAPELFEAYPDISRAGFMVLDFGPDRPDVVAYYDNVNDYFAFNANLLGLDTKKIREFMIHEIQHAVQVREGFASGGSPLMFKTNKKGLVNINPFIRRNYARNEKLIYSSLSREQKKKFRELKELEKNSSQEDFIEVLYDTLSDAEIDKYSDWRNSQEHRRYASRNKTQYEPFMAYLALAGEVEARNAARRSHFTKNKKQNTPLHESEEVQIPREAQFVVDNEGRAYNTNNDFITPEQLERFNQNSLHGTGHIIEGNQPDLSHVGSGQGAASYGYGFYSAQARGVAEYYRTYGLPNNGAGTLDVSFNDGQNFSISNDKDFENISDNVINQLISDMIYQRNYHRDTNGTPAALIENLKSTYSFMLNEAKKTLKRERKIDKTGFGVNVAKKNIERFTHLLEQLNNIKSLEFKGSKNGNIYKFDVPEDYELLDWDAKLSKQPDNIKSAIREAVDMINNNPAKGVAKTFAHRLKKSKSAMAKLENIIRSLQDQFNGHYINSYERKSLPEYETVKNLFYAKDKNAADDFFDAINALNKAKHFDEANATGEKLYWALTDLLGSDINASMYLNSLGIPGHRYLDEFSREEGKGTHNFVVWNMNKLKMLGITDDSDTDAKEYFARTKARLEQADPENITPENLGENNNLVADSLVEKYNQDMLHGTGHILLGNKFDLGKMSSGEGHQAFGWGAYLAQARGVAQRYRKYGLSSRDEKPKIYITDSDSKSFGYYIDTDNDYIYEDAKTDRDYTTIALADDARKLLQKNNNLSLDEVKNLLRKQYEDEIQKTQSELERLEEDKKYYSGRDRGKVINIDLYINRNKSRLQELHEQIKALDKISDFRLEKGKKGNIYQFDGPEDDVLLDWDEALDNQPEHVLKAIEKIKTFARRLAKLSDLDYTGIEDSYTGEDLYRSLAELFADYNGVDEFDWKTDIENKKQASFLFNKFGVPGLRFWDGFSRDKQSGTHNFVIWDADTVKLMGLTEDSDSDAKEYFTKTKAEEEKKIKQAQDLSKELGAFGDDTAERYAQHFNRTYARDTDSEVQKLLERNRKAEPAFRNLMNELQKQTGGRLITRAQMKSPERIIAKANRLFGGDVSRVPDVWAGTLVFDTEEDLFDALKIIKRRRDLNHLDNRWNRPKRSSGYRDIISNFRLNDGTLVELQLQIEDMQEVKDSIGHSIYEFTRSNKHNDELYDTVWDAGEVSKVLYDSAINGSYRKLSQKQKETLHKLGEDLARSSGVEQAQKALTALQDFIDENLSPDNAFNASSRVQGTHDSVKYDAVSSSASSNDESGASKYTRPDGSMSSGMSSSPSRYSTANGAPSRMKYSNNDDSSSHDNNNRKLSRKNHAVNDPQKSFLTQQKINDFIERYNQEKTHATGHIIIGNRFKLNMAGSGEGGSLFGHGIYLETDPEVAQSYRRYGLSDRSVEFTTDDGTTFTIDELSSKSDIDDRTKRTLSRLAETLVIYRHDTPAKINKKLNDAIDLNLNVIKEVRKATQSPYLSAETKAEIEEQINKIQKTIDFLRSIKNIKFKEQVKGNIYRVDIPEDNELLNWDKLLSEQPEEIKPLIDNLVTDLKSKGITEDEILGIPEFAAFGAIDNYFEDMNYEDDITGGALYQNIYYIMHSAAEEHSDAFDFIDYSIEDKEKRAKAATSYLFNKHGIPGHRYWDRMSRSIHNGTHNYVIWNEDKLKILGLTEDSDDDAKEYFARTQAEQEQAGSDNGESYNQNANDTEVFDTPEEQLQAVRAKYEGTSQWLKAPNGKKSNLTERQWLQVRTPAFKKWFGDWEAAQVVQTVKDFLDNSKAVGSITGNEFQKDNTPLVDRVMDYYNETGNTIVHNKELGDVILDRRGIKDSSAHGLGKEKAAAFALVPDVIKNGLVYNRENNWKGRGYDTATIIANVRIGGEDYVCEVIVKKSLNKQGFYLHEVELKKDLDEVFKTALNNGTSPKSRLIISDFVTRAAKASKVVDENGEPLVVYHGTLKENNFSIFRTNPNGIHFGTRESSIQRIAQLVDLPPEYRNATSIEEIMALPDIPESYYTKDAGKILGVFLYAPNIERAEDQIDDWRGVIKYAKSKGAKGIIYVNDVEDAGSDSFIVFKPIQIKSATDNTGEFNPSNPDIYHQTAPDNPFVSRHHFDNPDTEQAYSEAKKGIRPESTLLKIRHSIREFMHGFKGDFPDLATSEAKAAGLTFARETLRKMNRNLGAKTQEALDSIAESLKGLTPEQFDIFGRVILIDDLLKFREFNEKARLPLGFTPESLEAADKKFKALAKRDPKIDKAIESENSTHEAINKELAALAKELGMPKFAKNVLRYNFNLLDIARMFKGESINADYIQAVGLMRQYQLQDIERLRAIKDLRDRYDIKAKLVKEFGKDWRKHVPEDHRVFNPLQAQFVSSAHTLTENILGMVLEELGKKIGLDDEVMKEMHRIVADNSDSHLLVLPKALADTLDKMSVPKVRGPLGNIAKTLTTGWKKYTLYFLTKAIKYNMRNITGDADAVMSGNPAAFLKVPHAYSDLANAYFGDGKKFSSELKEFQKRGGALTTETSQELEDYKKSKEFRHLISELGNQDISAWRKLPASLWHIVDKIGWSGVQKITDFREQILRYATYLSYLEQMQNNKDGTPNNWGASVPEEVMSLPDIRDRAFKMANELLGAYDQISETGKAMRDIAIPFYSWIEVNAKRYYQLIKNGIFSNNPKDFAGRFLKGQLLNVPYYSYKIGKTYLMINLLAAIISAFNHFAWPADDEDKLPPDIQQRPHLTLGHDPVTGDIIYFDRVGALLDNLEWFGQDSTFAPFYQDIKDIFDGRQTFTDFIGKITSSSFNKVVNALNPIFKLPVEVAAGRTFYPEATKLRKINDRGKYLAQSFGLQWPYKAITGEAHSNWKDFLGLFMYTADADEAAYFYTLGKVREFQEKVLGKRFDSFASTPRGEVLRKLKTALRFDDRAAVQRHLAEYYRMDGSRQGLKTSMKNMNPLHGLNKQDQQRFLRWLSPDDRKYLNRANKYFHSMADRFLY